MNKPFQGQFSALSLSNEAVCRLFLYVWGEISKLIRHCETLGLNTKGLCEANHMWLLLNPGRGLLLADWSIPKQHGAQEANSASLLLETI